LAPTICDPRAAIGLDPRPVQGVPTAELPRLGAGSDTVLEEVLHLDRPVTSWPRAEPSGVSKA
jgi:hypothetical protein